jgi:diguanylate cyclase (GGDEF)-like protein
MQLRLDRRFLTDDHTLLLETRRELEALRTSNGRLLRELKELRRREAQARRLAGQDELTGLCNRRLMQQSLAAALDAAARSGSRVGLLFIDLDGFKAINDHHGHATGDSLLAAAGARIATRARKIDIVCRYGGDEFVVVLPGVPDRGAVRQIADQIRAHLALPYWVHGTELRLTAAVGIAVFPDHAQSAQELLQRADESMYRAKSTGRRRVAASRRKTMPHDTRLPARQSASFIGEALYARALSAATIGECPPTEV